MQNILIAIPADHVVCLTAIYDHVLEFKGDKTATTVHQGVLNLVSRSDCDFCGPLNSVSFAPERNLVFCLFQCRDKKRLRLLCGLRNQRFVCKETWSIYFYPSNYGRELWIVFEGAMNCRVVI